MALHTPTQAAAAVGACRPVVIVDASSVYCLGLSHALRESGLEVSDIDELPSAGDRGRWVALVTDGQPVPETASDEQCALVVLLRELTPEAYATALERGAVGVVGRDSSIVEIVAVVRAAVANRVLLPPTVARWLATRRRRRRADGVVSVQEAQWLQALATGQTVADLARSAGYSERELYRRLRNVYGRLGAAGRAEALVRATYLGIVDTSVGPPAVRTVTGLAP